jgi:hypothetical protein
MVLRPEEVLELKKRAEKTDNKTILDLIDTIIYLGQKLNEKEKLDCNTVKNYKVITLCGSTKFKDEFIKIQKELTLSGHIVISVGLFGHFGDDEVWRSEETKEMLDDMHLRKIDMADAIFVINKNGYIGSSTRNEIAYALTNGKEVLYLE